MDSILRLLRLITLCSVLITGVVAVDSAVADTAGPGWITDTAEPVSPQQAKTVLMQKRATPALLAAQSALPQAAASSSSDYAQLAEALENDPRRIYQFVRNHFEYVPYYGALKGPHLTLLERSGNDFDQAALLVELLRAAGYTANYQYGTMNIPLSAAGGMDLANWLGTQADNTIIGTIIAAGGIPLVNQGSNFIVDRVWVVVDIGGTLYELDPAFKPSTDTGGIDLTAAMGYDQAALLTAAGGTMGTDSISNLDQGTLDSHLDNLTSTLVANLKQNNFNAQVRDIVGGREIVPDSSSALPAALPFAGTPTEPQWASIPSSYMHTVRIVHGGIDTTQNIPDIAGRKLSITYVRDDTVIDPPPQGATDFGTVNSGGDGQTIIWTNTNPNPVTVQVAASLSGSNAFSFVAGGGNNNLSPGGSLETKVKFSATGQSAGRKNATLTFTWSYNGSVFSTNVVPLTGVVETTPIAEIHLDDELLVAEGTPTGSISDFVLTIDHPYAASSGTFADQSATFNLNRSNGSYVLASAFGGDRNSKLLSERRRLLNAMTLQGMANDSREVLTETLNVIGQTWMQQTQLNAELIGAVSDHLVLRHHRFGITGQEAGYFVDVKAQFVSLLPETTSAVNGGFQASSFVASAMEHSVLEQLQGSGNPGISTIKIFALSNQNGNKFFLANQGNFGTIQPQLSGYSTNDLSQFQSAVNNNGTLILPENGQVTLNDWSGKGYVDYRVNGNARSLGMIIGGGLNGGFASIPMIVNPQTTQNNYIDVTTPPGTITRNTAADPVDLNSGAFISRITDLSIAGSGPRGLSFTRIYNSQQAGHDTTGLGRGWTHNSNIYLSEHSDVETGLGMRTPIDAASLIVAAFTTRDLMEATQPTLQAWTVGALVADWATDQLLGSSVSVHLGDQALSYRQLPDGSYAPPPGVTTELVKLGGGTYELRERFGTVIAFNSDNKIATLTDIDGNSLTFTYSGDRLTQVKDTYNRSLTLNYTGNQLTGVNDANGRSVTYTQTGEDLTGVTGLESANWSYTYDASHRIETVINPETVTIVDNTYDASGKVIEQRAPRETGITTYKMHYTGLTSAEEDPLGNRVTYHYDFTGRTVAVEDALGNRSNAAYDGQGQTTQLTDARGNTTIHGYDGFNNRTQATNALTQVTDFSYDAQHRLERVTDALSHNAEIDYDAKHRPIATRDGENNEATTAYLTNGLVNSQTDPRLTATSYTYDSNGYPETAQTATEPAVTTVYDAIGRMTRLTDQVNTQTNFVYDDRGLVTERIDPFNRKTLSSYDNLGRLISQTDRNNQTVTTSYTASGKLDAINYPGHSVTLDYDSRDNLTTMTDPLGTTTNSFDSLNRLTGHTDPNGFQVQYDYDEAGNLTQLTYPGNKTVSYSYDELNRVNQITIDWLGVTATPTYDNAGRLTGIAHFNGATTSYSYDNADRLTAIGHQANGQTLVNYAYTLDKGGNRTDVTTTNEPVLPTTLTSDTQSHSYNSFKNRLEQATIQGVSIPFSYDNEGQLQSKDTTNFSFDSAHRLTGYGTNSYQYDGVGNRLIATRNGTVTKYIYDAAGNLLADADATNTIQHYYIHGLGLMAMVDAQTNQLYVYHFDGTGHTVAMTDSNQATVNKYGYTPFGKLLGKTETIPQPFTYVGQYGVMTEADNLYYMRARYYDAEVGRFIKEDPIGFAGGLNLYAYVGGNPVNVIDPSGEIGIIGAVFGAAFELGVQMATNGWDVGKVDWVDVGMMGAVGFVAPSVFGSAGKAYKSYKASKVLSSQLSRAKAASKIAKLGGRIKNHTGIIKRELATQGAIAAGKYVAKKFINDPDFSGTENGGK